MGRHQLHGNPPIDVTLRKSARAKRLSLRVSRLDGRVTLTMPQHTAEREALAFLRTREDWLRGHLSNVAETMVPQIGGSLLYQGRELPIQAGAVRRAQLHGGVLLVPDAPDRVGARIAAFLKAQARGALAAASDEYAAKIGRKYTRLSLRDTRSRWGSCSSQGVLMYSWRLIMAPPQVLQYVAAHEVAHLVEMNHSAQFWAQVARVFPEYESCRHWLRENGDQLHRVQFGD